MNYFRRGELSLCCEDLDYINITVVSYLFFQFAITNEFPLKSQIVP